MRLTDTLRPVRGPGTTLALVAGVFGPGVLFPVVTLSFRSMAAGAARTATIMGYGLPSVLAILLVTTPAQIRVPTRTQLTLTRVARAMALTPVARAMALTPVARPPVGRPPVVVPRRVEALAGLPAAAVLLSVRRFLVPHRKPVHVIPMAEAVRSTE